MEKHFKSYFEFSNIRISNEGNLHMLEINNVQLEQAGELACTVKNSAGSKRQNAHLTVKESGGAPAFERSIEVNGTNEANTARTCCSQIGIVDGTEKHF